MSYLKLNSSEYYNSSFILSHVGVVAFDEHGISDELEDSLAEKVADSHPTFLELIVMPDVPVVAKVEEKIPEKETQPEPKDESKSDADEAKDKEDGDEDEDEDEDKEDEKHESGKPSKAKTSTKAKNTVKK